MTPTVLWSTRDWSDAIAALPTEGALPTRTALVPREAVAHSLRRELIRNGRPEALAGTRFLPTLAAAVAVLQEADVRFDTGEEAVRPARLLRLFSQDLGLAHFPPGLLRERPGWDDAFARTIGDLEAAGLRPEHLAPHGDARLRDIAAVWSALDAEAGASWTAQRVYLEAAQALEAAHAHGAAARDAAPGERAAKLWPFPGRTLATVSARTSAAEARFLRAISGAAIALHAARPVREHYLTRIERLLGPDASAALRTATAPRAAATERDLLASYLFEPPDVLTAPGRPRSDGPDGTVTLEEHEGVEDEVEATADWVAGQVLAGVPLEDIAVLVPALDPVAGLVAERLARLPWHEGALPVHVGGGLPLSGTAAGSRALAVVRALREHLSADALARVLPALRTVPDDRHLSHGAAMDVAWSMGTAGGNAANPQGALDWPARLAQRETSLAARVEEARAAGDDPERAAVARQRRDLERLLAGVRGVRPAVRALTGVARLILDKRPLAEVWPTLCAFLADWLLQPGSGPRVQALLDERLDAARADGGWGALTGDDALRVMEDALMSLRVREGRFGEPAVHVGTVRDAVGLRFAAVRVIGLAEGQLPPLPREDPVLPDALRARLAAPAPTAADDALEALHALDAVVRDAARVVALSAPRLDVERTQREPSAVILEAAAALARPSATTGERRREIPDATALRRDAFLPAHRAALDFRHRTPLAESAWHDTVAAGVFGVPRRWRGAPALDLERVCALQPRPEPSALDGFVGDAAAHVPMAGSAPDRPISPSALETLLRCPHLFLLERALGLDEPAAAPAQREIEPLAYGTLVHRVAERFFRAHGERFVSRVGPLAWFLDEADRVVESVFAAFLEEYPLVGAAVQGRQRERLRDDVHTFLLHDWGGGGARRFVAVERAFGYPQGVALALPAGRMLHVRGHIDRMDVSEGRTLVRDLKTGRARPRSGRDADPDPTTDVQIAVYALVARQLAAQWRLPERVGAAYTYVSRGLDERSFRDDFEDTLEPAARGWLVLAADLLGSRLFPRTPDKADCAFCAFRPVCGDGAHERAATLLAGSNGALARFAALKRPEAGDDEG
jgi:hypothetical protein